MYLNYEKYFWYIYKVYWVNILGGLLMFYKKYMVCYMVMEK